MTDEEPSRDKNVLLVEALFKGDMTTARSLIDEGATVNTRMECGYGPEVYAFEGCLVNWGPQPTYATPLHIAVKSGDINIVRRLLDNGAKVDAKGAWGDTPLAWAVYDGLLDIAQLLIQRGADVSDKYGTFLLDLACNSLSMTTLLINSGAKVIHSKNGRTPLLSAVRKGNIDVCRMLIDNGADVNAEGMFTFDGDTFCEISPLHLAAHMGNVTLGEFLISKFAYVNLTNKEGKTPIMIAKEERHFGFAQMLLTHGAIDSLSTPSST